METLIAVALALSVAGAENQQQTRREIVAFIETVNPSFEHADRAANQLLYCQHVAGVDARLLAALVAQERRWKLVPNGPYGAENLCQITHGTALAVFGQRRAETWELNLLWGAWILKGCLRAEKHDARAALARYNRGPRWRERPEALRYAEAVLSYRRRMGNE